MKRIQTVMITILIALALWYLLNRPASGPGTSQQPVDISAEETDAEVQIVNVGPRISTDNSTQSPTPPISTAVAAGTSGPPLKPLSEKEIVERRSSIRATLTGLYTAQAAYFAEYDRYSSDLGHIGYLPAEGTIKARFGFLESFTPNGGLNSNEDPSRSSSDAFVALKDDGGDAIYQYDDYSKPVSLAKYERYCDNRCTVTADQFELISAVNLDADETLDVWIIDSKKNIRHVVDDTKE